MNTITSNFNLSTWLCYYYLQSKQHGNIILLKNHVLISVMHVTEGTSAGPHHHPAASASWPHISMYHLFSTSLPAWSTPPGHYSHIRTLRWFSSAILNLHTNPERSSRFHDVNRGEAVEVQETRVVEQCCRSKRWCLYSRWTGKHKLLLCWSLPAAAIS